MELLDSVQVLQALCAGQSRFGMYIRIELPDDCGPSEALLAAPYLVDSSGNAHFQIICNGEAWILFDTFQEMESAYDQTVGDDGPTESNSYNGPARVYALTCDLLGALRNENT